MSAELLFLFFSCLVLEDADRSTSTGLSFVTVRIVRLKCTVASRMRSTVLSIFFSSLRHLAMRVCNCNAKMIS